MATTPIGVFLPAFELFPGLDSNVQTLESLLNDLSLTDTLFWSARLNLIVCSTDTDHLTRQQFGLDQFLTTDDIQRVNEFARRHGGAEHVTVFFRGQLLELTRWAVLYCTVHPDDGRTFEEAVVRRKFAQAALVAGDLWSARVYGDRFRADGELDLRRRRSLGAIRKAIEGTMQTPELSKSLGRGWTFFSEYLPRHNQSFVNNFLEATGLCIEDYFICMGGMMTSFMDATLRTGLFDASTVGESTPYAKVLQRFINLESQTANDLRTALWGTGTESTTGSVIPDYDYRALRLKPIFQSVDKRAIILDPVFFSEKASIGAIFLLPPEQRQQAIADFGKAFESYCGDMLDRMFPDIVEGPYKRLRRNIITNPIEGSSLEIDACLNDGPELVFFEIKSGLIREDSILADDYEILLRQLRKKYVWSEEEKGVGVGQLAKVIDILAAKKWIGNDSEFRDAKLVFPVLLVHDPLLAAPVYGHVLAEEFKAILAPDTQLPSGELQKGQLRVAQLILMTVDDLENLETSVEHFGFRDLLSAYSQHCPDRMMSLHNFIATSSFKDRIYHNRTIAAAGLKILGKVEEKIFEESND